MPGSKTGLSKSTFTVERHKKVLTQVKKSDVRTPKTGKIKNQHYAKVSIPAARAQRFFDQNAVLRN
jgi:hypothetical protein